MSRARAGGYTVSSADGQIAVADVHVFAVATWNRAPFEAAGLKVVDPWHGKEDASGTSLEPMLHLMEIWLTPKLEQTIRQAATERGCDPKTLAADALLQMFDYDAWFAARVEEGLADAEGGRLVLHDEVMRRAQERLLPRHPAAL